MAIGQRDVNPSIQSVTIRGLEGQKYDSELNNPNNFLLGNIDFSFVLIYLFPLLIIAFTYNIDFGRKRKRHLENCGHTKPKYLFIHSEIILHQNFKFDCIINNCTFYCRFFSTIFH